MIDTAKYDGIKSFSASARERLERAQNLLERCGKELVADYAVGMAIPEIRDALKDVEMILFCRNEESQK